MKKKILFLSPLPPPHYGSAVSSKMCLNILKESDKFQVKNIKLNYSKDIADVGKINSQKIKGIFYVKKQIKKIIKEFKPDFIYFVPATYSFGLIRDWLFVREIKKHRKGKILFHIRSRILKKTWKSVIGRKLLKDIYRENKAIVLGKELINDLRGIILRKDIRVLPNAVKNEVSNNELKNILLKRKKNKQFNILFLSNMDKTKGWMNLLDACEILNKKKFNFRCDFVGGWLNKNDEEYFTDFVKRNELKKGVFAHGKKTGKEKNKFLEKANCLVLPTGMDTFGKVLIEAYMFGVPIIANKEGAIPSIINEGRTGFLLNENTSEEIVKKILEHKNWEKMGITGRRKFLKEFEIKKYEKKFFKFFK
ncbi:MAG: glycosyltransferase [archaeon]